MYRSHKDKLWKTTTISYRNNLPARIGYSNKPSGSSNNDILQPLINNKISIWDTGDTTYKSKINDVTSMPQINNIYLFSLNENEKQIINDLEKSFKKFNLTKSVKTIVLKSESKNLSKIPEFILQCDSLETLEITANIKSLPKKLSKLTQIKILQIEASGGIDIRKAIKILRKLPNLRSLTIVNTKEHLIPIEINQLTNLVTLNLDHSKRDRNGNLFPLPKELYELKKLNYLEVPQEIINAKLLYSNIPDCLFIYTRPQTK